MEKVILVGVNIGQNTNFDEEIEEMKQLVFACDMEVQETIVQNLRFPNKKTCINTGKIEEVNHRLYLDEIETVVFNVDLTPSQQRELEAAWKCTVIDRTYLILQIFEKRAKTKEAFLQVEVATLKYFLPRLQGSYTHMDRQRGGQNKGTGEKKIEIDSRTINRQIQQAEKELKKLEAQRSVQRKQRNKSGIKKVALVGYTNAGKSSILNAVVDKKVFEKDMLFATLTTNTRLVELENKHSFLLSDTVGFVSNLPHTLVEAFHSTLEEVKEADLLLHVMDSHSIQLDKQKETTIDTLSKIDASNIPVLHVFNKCDLSNIEYPFQRDDNIYISAKDENSIQVLLNKIDSLLYKNIVMELLIPYEKGNLVSKLNASGKILEQSYKDNGTYIKVELLEDYKKEYEQYSIE